MAGNGQGVGIIINPSLSKPYDKVVDLIENSCALYKDRRFTTVGGADISYGNFGELLEATTGHFKRQGIRERQRVVIRMPNSLAFPVAFLGLLRTGMVPCLVSAEMTDAELHDCCRRLQAVAVVSAQPGMVRGDDVSTVEKIEIEPTNIAGEPIADPDDRLAYVTFTSGSTGRAKAIRLSHRNVLAELAGMIEGYQLGAEDVHYCILPLYHASALYRNFLIPFAQGARVVLEENYQIGTFWENIARHKITFVQVVPTVLKLLLGQKPKPAPSIQKHLRYIGSASAPHPPALIEAFEERFDVMVLQGYGMSEATCGIALNPLRWEERIAGSVGRLLPQNTARVLSDDGTVLPVGEPGRVQIKGDNIMLGYLEESVNDKIRIVDGWLESGDCGYLDEAGNLFLLGREGDMIKRGGYRLSPLAIENALLKCEGVTGAVALSIPHEILGQDVVCYVTAEGAALSRRDLQLRLRELLPASHLPSDIIAIDKMPMLGIGKVDRRALERRYREMRKQHKKS